jgi:beta/gamma crystallin
MRRLFAALFTAALLAAALSASAQEERVWRPPGGGQGEGEISLFRQTNFQGPHIRAQTAVPDIGAAWTVRSVRIARGQWELCTGANYTGRCNIVRQDAGNISLISPLARTRSLRPVSNNPPPAGGGATGPSLRGMGAAFYTEPSYRGQRIPACARGQTTPACARTTATEFCRVNGYNYVGNVALQTERGRAYLADVLCKRSAS